jgi:hypothetical protein
MNNKKNSLSGFKNDKSFGASGYVLRQTLQNTYVAAFSVMDWSWVPTDDADQAMLFVSMTQALTVGFCLGFGTSMEAISHTTGQASLPFV